MLTIFGGILSLQAVVLPVLILIFGVMSSNSPINYNGERAPIGDVRLQVVGMLLVWFAFAALVGPGLWRGNSRARDAAMTLFVVALAAKLIVMQIYKELPLDLAFTGLVAWYLYRKPNVVAFFHGA